ncbi:Sensor histidine kinase RcsC [Brevundimonas sp. NIBR10]|uniref:hybrid sensor histidine kinase/response regulator n=1 Tax=Brevundimonas sp. NIBR10 TaxID=3015997 RepID=UPI0022F1466A|nr:ATP-binding protein [Brevundimonas sp. NIBR10]WGM47218.1 Sensor histidine kinase RcsC [Brevundimonas sp. NIBR10]
MSEASALTRAHLLRLILVGLLAVATVLLAVGGMIAYSAHVLDRMNLETQTALTERRVERRLEGLREDVISATVWNEAYTQTLAGDADWMQINYGDYFADYMNHEVSLAYDGAGRVTYASRDSEAVDPRTEAALTRAVQPLVDAVRTSAPAPSRSGLRSAYGLDTVVTRQATVMVGAEPYFVSVSTVVPEDAAHAVANRPDPIVVSGLSARTFVATLDADLMLDHPRLIGPEAPQSEAWVVLKDSAGRSLGAIEWTPDHPSASLLSRAIPALIVLVLLLLVALGVGGLRVYRLIRDLAYNEEALDRTLGEAKAANAAKSQFLANMSHELRTPLNGVIAMTELLYAHQIDERGREMARTIVASGQTLEHVVNDILDVAKIEAGQLQFEIAPFDLAEVLRSAAALHGASAAAKGVSLGLTIHPDAEGVYAGDKTRVSQVVTNLVGNAVKFTESGCVQLTARRHNGGKLCISVSDTGIGFDRATAARLFQRFEQADVSVSRQYGGTGLGLSICASLSQMMGGSVTVRSVPGKGSTFFAHLPLRRLTDVAATPADLAPAAHSMPSQVSLRVLYADDHAINRQVVAMILEPLGVDLTLAETGVEALDLFKAAPFDLILMDVQMPQMDGLTATRALRTHEAAAGLPRTPVISLTANAMADDIRRSLDAGSDMHLAKPIRPAALIEAMESLLDASAPAPSTAVAA